MRYSQLHILIANLWLIGSYFVIDGYKLFLMLSFAIMWMFGAIFSLKLEQKIEHNLMTLNKIKNRHSK